MSREVRRVPLDFDAPIGDTWAPLLPPARLSGESCPDCDGGYSKEYTALHNVWWGYDDTFDPRSKGSEPLTWEHPAINSIAAWNLQRSPEFYGVGAFALMREGQRLAHYMNKQWMHHLSQDDVDILVASESGLRSFTHKYVKGEGYVRLDPQPSVTAKEVNDWSPNAGVFDGLGSSEEYTLLRAILEREGKPYLCPTCNGQGTLEVYPGQSAEADAWEPPEVPTGPGWQMGQTVSEGGPVSPVFSTPEDLARWMLTDRWSHLSFEDALKWVTEVGDSFGSFVGSSSGIVDGVTAAAEGIS